MLDPHTLTYTDTPHPTFGEEAGLVRAWYILGPLTTGETEAGALCSASEKPFFIILRKLAVRSGARVDAGCHGATVNYPVRHRQGPLTYTGATSLFLLFVD